MWACKMSPTTCVNEKDCSCAGDVSAWSAHYHYLKISINMDLKTVESWKITMV